MPAAPVNHEPGRRGRRWNGAHREGYSVRSFAKADRRPCGGAPRRPVHFLGQWLAGCLLGMLLSVWAGTARSEAVLSAPITSQPMANALAEFARRGPACSYYCRIGNSRRSASLKRHRPSTGKPDALTQLLRGTGLKFQFLNPKAVPRI